MYLLIAAQYDKAMASCLNQASLCTLCHAANLQRRYTVATPRLCKRSHHMIQVLQPLDTDCRTNTGWLCSCHKVMIVLDASVDILHNCPGAEAKLELHRSRCSQVPPVQQMKQCMNIWPPKPRKQKEAIAVLWSVQKFLSASHRAEHALDSAHKSQPRQQAHAARSELILSKYSCSSPLG